MTSGDVEFFQSAIAIYGALFALLATVALVALIVQIKESFKARKRKIPPCISCGAVHESNSTHTQTVTLCGICRND